MTPIHDSDGQLALGEPAPDFSLPNVDGATVSLGTFRGKVKGLCVIFSCNHCPYVIKWEDRMIALGRDYAARGIPFILIGSNNAVTHPQDNFENMKRRAREKGYPFPYLRDESQAVAHAYGAKTTPHIFLFDDNLKLVFRGAIDDNCDDPGEVGRHYLRDALETLLQGRADAIDPQVTRPVGCSVKWK